MHVGWHAGIRVQKAVAAEVDIVMLTTPLGYRPMQFEAGKPVFTE